MSKKILFLSHSFRPAIGGIETMSEILATRFTEAGHDVRLVTWSPDPAQEPFPFTVIRCPGKRRLFQIFGWADVVFENNPCLRLSWPNLFFSRPLVVALHTWLGNKKKPYSLSRTLKYGWLKRAASVIAVSNAIKEGCWQKATVIGNPYNEELFRPAANTEKTDDFVFVGRLVSDKGADLAIRAVDALKKAAQSAGLNKKITLTIIGDGAEKPRLEGLAADLKLQDAVRFKGFLRGKELAACLSRHRFMVVPSVWAEPFGLVALEGMACGCVPVVSDAGGLPDAVGNAGLVFRTGDVQALAACMKNLLENTALEQACRKAAVQHLGAHQTKQVARRYLDVIEALHQ